MPRPGAAVEGPGLRLEDFDYALPHERIAQKPLERRDASRLLLLDRSSRIWRDHRFQEFPELLRGDELLVVNNTRVLPVRLLGRRAGIHALPAGRSSQATGFLQAPIEVLLVREHAANVWEALVKPGRKVPIGERLFFGEGEIEAEVVERGAFGLRKLHFSGTCDVRQTLERIGHVPLPPYIKRADEPADRERYQTLFARQGCAVAAPTAGLHFSAEILERLKGRGIEIAELTLEIGLGTFEPIREARLEDHRMHREAYEIPEVAAAAIARARREKRPVVAVGTTVVRALEDAVEKAAERDASAEGIVFAGRAEAGIFIRPGHRFRVVDQMLTNFHLPQSSLLILVAAFAGRELILDAYRHAVEQNYRFYSYGDCMLIRGSAAAGAGASSLGSASGG